MSEEEILEIAHRTANRYWHEGFDRYDAIRYGFSDKVIVDFARKILAAKQPLNGDQILEGVKEAGLWPDAQGKMLQLFTEGVRFAERMRERDV